MKFERLLCAWFGAGWMKPAPGTWGSAAALPLAWLLWDLGGHPALAGAMGVVFLVGWWASARIVRADGLEDPSWVVIDEVAGQWMVLLFTEPSLVDYAIGFALFRLFDIWKPWPVSWADQKIKGGLGIMLDDIIAGLMGLAVMMVLGRTVHP